MKFLKPSNRTAKRIVATGAFLVLLSGLVPANSNVANAATAQKSATGTYEPNSTAAVEIRLAAPISSQKNIEVSFALDASGSMSGDFNSLKSEIKNFAAWVYNNGYASKTTISVLSFSRLPCSPLSANLNYDTPNIEVAVNRVKLTSASSINSAVDGMQPSYICSGESQYYGFSDVTAGVVAAGNQFTTSVGDPNSEKILVLLSDGFQNMPAAGSGSPNAYSTNWTGACALTRSGGNDAINIAQRHDQFYGIVAGGQSGSYLPMNTSNYSGIAPFNGSCHSYLAALGASVTGGGYVNRMVNAFPGGSNKTITSAVASIKNTLVNAIQINDYLNPNVFTTTSGTISNITVVNCANGAAISGADIRHSGNRIYGTIPYSSSVADYCIRFNATINGSPTPGTPDINSSGNQPANCTTVGASDTSKNIIRYIDATGKVQGCDTISLGQVTIVGHNDIRADYFRVVGHNGTSMVNKDVFLDTEQIYVDSYISNRSNWDTRYQHNVNYYKHNTQYALYARVTWAMWSYNDGGWISRLQSFPGAASSSYFPSAKSWTMTPGNYTARMVTTYYNDPNGGNNTATDTYAVVSLPSNLNYSTDNLRCNSAQVSWTAGGNATDYHIDLRPAHGNTYPVRNITGTSYTFSGLQPNTNYQWRLSPNTTRGESGAWTAYAAFRTPACPEYVATPSVGSTVIPGKTFDENNGNVTIDIDYNPSPAIWDLHEAELRARVVGIQPGNTTCGGLSPNGAVVANAHNLHVRLSGNESTAETTFGSPTTPISYTVYADGGIANGEYTICFGIADLSGTVLTPDDVYPLVVRVEDLPWLQITNASDTPGSWTGDVHSNGPMTINIPANEYFFRNGTAGVVSSVAGIIPNASNTANIVRNSIINRWRITDYQAAELPRFQSLLNQITVNHPEETINTNIAMSSNLNAVCASGGDLAIANWTGTWTRNSALSSSSAVQCNNTNLIIFIEGDVVHNAPITDDFTNSTITIIASGNVTVNPSVQRLDGVHIFDGTFASGSGDQQLVVHGSLIGLGHSVAANAGSFASGLSNSSLQRDLGFGNGSQPGEKIYYQPKYLYMLQDTLGEATYTWSE